ncbi:MAG TPA: ABC transporter ATP-binding protein [Acidimicrobiia bacterium]|nr:ABC transporter ATP-binding protein [Acidimicrobiia bacterium]
MTGAAPAPVAVRGLSVVRGGKLVLADIGFALEAGLVTGLLGPSGSGKSTLMRSLVGVQANVTGTVDVLGHPAGIPALRSRVAYVTQAPSVYLDLTVAENLRYFARLLGAPDAAVNRTLATVGLAAESGKVVGRLSGGQLSRVSLATALLGGPEVLVLDEPTVGLDPVLRRELWDHFHRLAAEGTTLLVSSHVMDEADRCDHLLLLHEGRLLASGTPDDLRRATGADHLEEAFINLIRGSAG